MSIAEIIPISLREANRFIEKHHRHSGRAQGCKFCVALSDESGVLHGVAVVGRSISRYLDDGRTAEVTRLCTDGTFNGCSFLYGLRAGPPGRRELECTGPPPDGEPEHRPETNVLQGIEVKQVVFDFTMLRNTLWPGSVLFTGRTSPAAHFRQHKGRVDRHKSGKGEKEQHERHPVRHGGKGRASGSAGRL
ncbi:MULTISPECIES: XF1762 family protein [Eubacteriales]|uniref:XF1762 family protein n=1 Tax=Eubacteriales TaxID=186802 RepID=UPI0036F43B33